MIFTAILLTMILKFRFSIDKSIVISFSLFYFIVLMGNFIGDVNIIKQCIFISFLILSYIIVYGYKNHIIRYLKYYKKTALIYLLFIALIISISLLRKDLVWDEFTTWGMFIKYLITNDALPSLSNAPVGLGATWYPWGLAVYAYSISYPFLSHATQLTFFVNILMAISLVSAVMNIAYQNSSNKSMIALLLLISIIIISTDVVFIGYADFSFGVSILISIIYGSQLVNNNNNNNNNNNKNIKNYIAFIFSLILIVSLKEPGKYVVLLILVTLFLSHYIRSGLFQTSLVIDFLVAFLISLFVSFIWYSTYIEYSSTIGREVALNLSENFGNFNLFLKNGSLLLFKNPRLYIPPLIVFVIGFYLSRLFKQNLVKLVNLEIIIFSILYFLFIIAAFLFTFVPSEFINANSLERYIEVIFVGFFLVSFIRFSNNFIFLNNKRILLSIIFLLIIVQIYCIHKYYNYIFSSSDLYTRDIANNIDQETNVSDGIIYVDYSTYGLHPIKLNYYHKSSRNINYVVASQKMHGEIIPMAYNKDANNKIILIDELGRLKCHKLKPGYRILNQKNINGLVYILLNKEDYDSKLIVFNDYCR